MNVYIKIEGVYIKYEYPSDAPMRDREQMEKGRVVTIRLNARELEEVEKFASIIDERSIGRAVKHAVLSHVFHFPSPEYGGDQTLMQETLRKMQDMQETLRKISRMVARAPGF